MISSNRSTAGVLFSSFLLAACGSSVEPSGAGGSSSSSDTSSGNTSSGSGGSGGEASACPTSVTPALGTVVTDRGAVKGALAGSAWSYKDIPFAAPPVGTLRWSPPELAACWEGARDATAWGNLCPQLDSNGKVVGKEECLSLNVWTPKDAPTTPLPVFVWIHGGAFIQGGAAAVDTDGVHVYDGAQLAAKGTIVVTINYRLGPLGYLAHPTLLPGTDGAEAPSSGNLGALDQIAALQWVQRNAAAFGGDPQRVTVAGESAGGSSVCSLVASPLAKGLFSSAIIQSGGCGANTRVMAEDYGAQVFTAAKCDTASDPAACMRALSADVVLLALPATSNIAGALSPYQPVIDTHLLTDAPIKMIGAGAHNHVPIMIGNNSDETSRSVPPGITTVANYQAAVKALFPTVAAAVLAQYPVASYPSPRAAFVAVTTDSKFVCSGRKALKAVLKGQSEPAFRYMLTHALDNGSATIKAFGAWHGIDVAYLFDGLAIGGYTPSAAEKALSAAMQDYWTRFTATHDPSGAGAPTWPKYDSSDSYLELDSTIAAKSGYRTAQCDFWESLIP